MVKKLHYEHLKKKWIDRHKEFQKKVWSKHGEALNWLAENTRRFSALASLSSLMLLSSPVSGFLPAPHPEAKREQRVGDLALDNHVFLVSDLSRVLPPEVKPLSKEEAEKVAEILSRTFGLKAAAELDGKSLNRSYGYIGQEQHLARYPADTMATHFDNERDAKEYYSYGMAPGLGAWGYFAPRASSMTEQDKLREKYYIAVQTFLAPGFAEHTREYITFFKYRKMLVVNPQNGKAIVAVIGDAGPADWTGKQLGGSPEVMRYLERVNGAQRGPVLYFFIDDPKDRIPLGPIEIRERGFG